MFDEHARRLIEHLPRLPGLDPVACRRALSRAYLLVIDGRIQTAASPALAREVSDLRPTLMKLVNALESVAVFDPLHGVDVPELTREASAFVAGEALSLAAEIAPEPDLPPPADPIEDTRIYTLLESALLFMIGGYDVNAATVASGLPSRADPAIQVPQLPRVLSGTRLCDRVSRLCRGDLRPSVDAAAQLHQQPVLLDDLVEDTRTRLYEALVAGIDGYLAWLGGGDDLEAPLAVIARVRQACGGPAGELGNAPVRPFPDIYHLASLLAVAMEATRKRSTVHVVPPPITGDPDVRRRFSAYVRARARGAGGRGFPLLWPSTAEYVRDCLPGPGKDAVVSMPTGSGKSFLAELAVAHALVRGWVLYLAPTNALVHQIRRDLHQALKPFGNIKVTPFVGGAEYTNLSDEEVQDSGFVGVMTPEKCALALRLNPGAFARCSLCVFDECHLLNDPNRGMVADVLLAQLFRAAPEMRVLLMSAMVANACELAEWLADVRGHEAIPSTTKWRPSRAARCFVFVDSDALDEASRQLHADIAQARGACTISREVPLGWIAGLSGPWTGDGADDYRATLLPLSTTVSMKRGRNGRVGRQLKSWKNRTGQAVAELLAIRGVPSINFLLSSRHHAFTAAGRVVGLIPDAPADGPLPQLVEAQLAVADVELGVQTALRDLLRKGISVHTSAMLQVEQAASERMFRDGKAKLMFATGTLAQGLNLPAIAVVVSGSQVGNPQTPPGVDAAAGLTRSNELILNAFGRAGRPGFSNQGVVALVSDEPFSATVAPGLNGAGVILRYPVLGEPDASVQIRSPIEGFIDALTAADPDYATRMEVALTPLLATVEGNEETAGAVLRRTFGGYRKRGQFSAEAIAAASERIADVKSRFLEGAGVPPWMPRAAMRAGVEFFRAQRMWEACNDCGLIGVDHLSEVSVSEWFEVLIEVMAHMPACRVSDYLQTKKTVTPLSRLGSLSVGFGDLDVVPWPRPEGWDAAWHDLGRVVAKYMGGAPLAEVGAALFGLEGNQLSSGRTDAKRGLPPVFKFVGDIIERALARDAGCLLALFESLLEHEHPEMSAPESLQALPLCVRNGCNSLDVLAWYRFGYRQRVSAHALAGAYPLPPDVRGDGARQRAVSDLKRRWLYGAPVGEPTLLDWARTIVLDSSSEV